MTIFGPDRDGITAETLWNDLRRRLEAKIQDDDDPPTILKMRDALDELRADGMIRCEEQDGEELWMPNYSREKKREMGESKQAALFE